MFAFSAALLLGDVYLHNPRGSNNKLNEQNNNVQNNNRLFDSQNNNRGGYNVGSLYFYEGERMSLSWTRWCCRAGCGALHRTSRSRRHAVAH